jgi:hypothetical protein
MNMGGQQAVNCWDNIKIDLGETVFQVVALDRNQ